MLIRGGTLLDLDGERVADLRLGSDGRIVEAVEPPDTKPRAGEGDLVVDATGKYVVPGGVDAHTHMHLPVGAVRVSDDFASGTAAAAVGGTTTVIDYVTPSPGEDPLAALQTWRSWAESSVVDYGLHMTFTEGVPEATVTDCMAQGVTSFKLDLADPQSLQVDDGVVFDLLRICARLGGLVTVHCENGEAIEALRRQALAEGRTGVVEHRETRPALLEAEAIHRVGRLAELAQAPVYVAHLSSAPGLAEVRSAQERGVQMMAETCPQYLHLDASLLERPDGEHYVCTPPLRASWHREELWEGLARGWVHTVATDHCPFWTDDRRRGTTGRPEGFADFTEVPGGLPGIETRLALVWQGVRAGRLTVADWVRLCAEAPARTFGLFPRKGCLRPGSDADVVIWDPERRQSLDAEALHMQTDHSPYEGKVVWGWPDLVLSRGRVVALDGEFVGEPASGRYLPRS